MIGNESFHFIFWNWGVTNTGLHRTPNIQSFERLYSVGSWKNTPQSKNASQGVCEAHIKPHKNAEVRAHTHTHIHTYFIIFTNLPKLCNITGVICFGNINIGQTEHISATNNVIYCVIDAKTLWQNKWTFDADSQTNKNFNIRNDLLP